MQKYKAVFFDFGGTLADTTPVERDIHHKFNLPMWRSRGYIGSYKDFLVVVRKVEKMMDNYRASARGRPELRPMLIGRGLGIRISKKQALQDFDDYIKFYLKNVKLYPHSKEVLAYIKRKGMKIVLISNGWANVMPRKMKKFGICKYFDLILVSGDIGSKKSDLTPFRIAMRKMKLKPSECLMVGDRLDEDAYAKKLGIDVCWVLTYPNFKYPKPVEKFDYKVKEISELKKILADSKDGIV